MAINSRSQLLIQGKITNQNEPIINVSVTLLHNSQIIAYSISNSIGEYKIKLPDNLIFDTSFSLNFSCIGYQKKIITLPDESKNCNFQLYVYYKTTLKHRKYELLPSMC